MSGQHLVLLVEESDSSIGFYDSETAEELGRISLSLWPHEVTVSHDGRTAYVTNFGLRDYDLTLGYAGNSVSVIDIASRCEIHRLYTATRDFQYWAPHGVKLSPDGRRLYVNVERVVGLRGIDPTAGPGQEQTKLLVYDIETRQLINSFALPAINAGERILSLKSSRQSVLFGEPFREQAMQSYGVPRGSHNFLFGSDGALWIFSGPNGISKIDPESGAILWQSRDFNGSVRGLALFANGNLLVSATNEVSIVNTKELRVEKKIGNLGVGQILYSQATPDGRYVLAPAVWEGQVLVIDVAKEAVIKRLTTGVDPVHIIVPPRSRVAYVTHGRSHWAAEIGLENFGVRRRIQTRGGPNGVDVAKWFPMPKRRTLTIGAVIPFTGLYSIQGREIRLGYDLWRDRLNAAGGVLLNGQPHLLEIWYEDSASATDTETLYRQAAQLIERSGIRFMFGGYPSVVNWGIARAGEEHDVLVVTFTGDDVGLYERGYRNLFGIMTSSQAAAGGLFETLWRRISPKSKTAAFIVANDATAIRRANELQLTASQHKVEVLFARNGKERSDPPFFLYSSVGDISDEFVRTIRDLTPDLVLHIGERQAAARLIQAAKKLRFTPGAMVSTCGVTASSLRTELGALANGLIGPVQWSACIQNYGADRFVSAQDYVRIYVAEHSEVPSYLAAGASACGVVLETGIRQVQSDDIAEVREELAKIDRPTFFGNVRFDSHGLNVAKPIVTVQLTDGRPGAETILGPDEMGTAGAKLVWPFPE